MGTWGVGAFQNDDAMDWVAALSSARDASVLRIAFDTVLNDDEAYIESPEASVALAAAAVVAAAIGAPGPELPLAVADWLAHHRGDVMSATVREAREAVSRVISHSELRDLWEDSDVSEWEVGVAHLLKRLAPQAG
jgi:hypothetical protein